MNDLDQMILNLKSQGKSLRQIGSDLHLSHEAIRKRLNVLSSRDHVSTCKRDKGLTPSTIENEEVSTASDARKSRTCEKSEVVVNQVSTKNAPSQTTTEGGNPLETPSDKLPECKKGAFPEVPSQTDDLFEAINAFLALIGIEPYRMQV